ncbi:MAG: tRNA (adenosine(37)-N6)-threonylcarbamoyltransferase complex transferase subunit TsaD [Flavobacteriales bacterium]
MQLAYKNTKDTVIIGIESSCDDTSVAILKNGNILANITAGQKIHEEYGGVVPELASRAHQQNLIPVVQIALKKSGIQWSDFSAIAYTRGPGLLGSLLVGSSFAKGLSLALNTPLLEVHHMKAHILAHFIKDYPEQPVPDFPFLCLTVSGGHTQLVKVNSAVDMQILGQTIDDAAGEAFDKAAKILGLTYPGGPLIDEFAQKGDEQKFNFTIPKIEGLNYSFSGLKTQFLYFIQAETTKNKHFIEENLADICASYQKTIIDFLMVKLKRAAKEHRLRDVAIAGGVSANMGLRNRLNNLAKEQGWRVFIPTFEYCTDNAAMIAMAGYFQFLENDIGKIENPPLARWNM